MSFKMHDLYTNPSARLLAWISKRCTVILSTGKKISFEKGVRCGCCSYEGSMTPFEELEYIRAMMLMGL